MVSRASQRKLRYPRQGSATARAERRRDRNGRSGPAQRRTLSASAQPELNSHANLAPADVADTAAAEGTLDVCPQGYGFLRRTEASYLNSADDFFVPANLIRGLGLRTGMVLRGRARPRPEGQQHAALIQVEAVDGLSPEGRAGRPRF